jgi:hypothetical protein
MGRQFILNSAGFRRSVEGYLIVVCLSTSNPGSCQPSLCLTRACSMQSSGFEHVETLGVLSSILGSSILMDSLVMLVQPQSPQDAGRRLPLLPYPMDSGHWSTVDAPWTSNHAHLLSLPRSVCHCWLHSTFASESTDSRVLLLTVVHMFWLYGTSTCAQCVGVFFRTGQLSHGKVGCCSTTQGRIIRLLGPQTLVIPILMTIMSCALPSLES